MDESHVLLVIYMATNTSASGYSGTPLIKKLGVKSGMSVYVKNSPVPYEELLNDPLDDVALKSRLCAKLDFVHLFTKSKAEFKSFLVKVRDKIKPDGMVWISWPKKASKVPTDITEDTIREVCLPMDFVDVKVCAVNEIWSGLKLVIRKECR